MSTQRPAAALCNPVVRIGLLFTVLLACVLSASAHGIRLFATAEGATIQGTLLYADGTPAAGAPVQAFAPDGGLIGEASTSSEGRFEFQARYRCRHRLVGDAGQGHRGLFTVFAEELPAGLPEYGGPEDDAPDAAPTTSPAASPGPETAAAPTPVDLDARVEAAVARQLRPLREQLDRYESAIRFRDILGGIGYLFGIAGLFVLVKARRARSVA